MHYTKPALKYEAQLALVVSRGLTVEDPVRALRMLKRIGYYRLSAYFVPFKVPKTDQFKPGATFGQIVDLYKFDCHLRLLFMHAIDKVEVGIRALITYELAHQLGPFGYADPNNFSPSYDHKQFMSMLAHEEERGSEIFVKHFRTKYTSEKYLPFWMVTELVSFGTLSKLTENLRTSVRKQLAKDFGLVEPVFVSWLHTIAYVRNLCAHHNRLWNRELSVKPILPDDWTLQGISNDRTYCLALIIYRLLKIVAPTSTWKSRLKDTLGSLPGLDLKTMQFADNWQELEIWK
jgi:abortive infection bacteriophage resistance protein